MSDFYTATTRVTLGPGTGLLVGTATVTFPATVAEATCHLLSYRLGYLDTDHKIRLIEVTSRVRSLSGTQATVEISATLQDQNGDDRFDAVVEVMVVGRSSAPLSYPQEFQQQARVHRVSSDGLETASSTQRMPFTISPTFAAIDKFVYGMEGVLLRKFLFLRDQYVRRMGAALTATRVGSELETTATLTATDNSPSDDRWSQDITVSAVGADNRVGSTRTVWSPNLLFTERSVSWAVPRGSVTLSPGSDPHRGVTLRFHTTTPIFAPMIRSFRIESTDGDHNLQGIGVRLRHSASPGLRVLNVEAFFFDADAAEGFQATVGCTIYHTRALSFLV